MKSKRLGRGLSSLVGPAVRVHVNNEPQDGTVTPVGEGHITDSPPAVKRTAANDARAGGGTPAARPASAMAPMMQDATASPLHAPAVGKHDREPGIQDSDRKSWSSDEESVNAKPRSAHSVPALDRSGPAHSISTRDDAHGSPGSLHAAIKGQSPQTNPSLGPSQSLGDDSLPTGVVMVDVGAVSSSPYQPRRTIDPEALQRLAESIRKSGLMQPIVVRPRDGRFELIAGERRLLAARQVGLRLVPAMVREVDDREAAELALVENMQREDLDPMERCHGFRNLMSQFGLTQAQVAQLVGVERSTVANLVRLAELEPEIQELVSKGELGLGHAKALLSLAEGPQRIRAAHAAVKRGWTVRKLEQAASRRSGGGMSAHPRAVEIADLEERLSAHLGTRVSVTLGRDKKKGKLVIEFYGIDHFEGLVGRMGFKGGM